MDTKKIPPHNIEAEEKVLGGILLDPQEGMDKCDGILDKEDFYVLFHKTVFEGMSYLYKNAIAITHTSLRDWAQARNILQQYPTFSSQLLILEEGMPSLALFSSYVDIIRKKSVVRKVLAAAVSIEELSYTHTLAETEEFLEEAEGRILLATTHTLNPIGEHVQIGVLAFTQKLEHIIENPHDVVGIPSGFGDLDKITLGFQKGDFVIIAARPGSGKTSIAMQMAYNAAHGHHKKAGFISLEMSKEQLIERLISMESRVPSEKMKVGNVNENEVEKIIGAAGKISETPLYVSDEYVGSSMELRRRMRRMVKEHGCDIIFVDYLQLIRGGKGGNREEEVAELSVSCKRVAKELHIPVVALAQLNRELEKRQDKRPLLSDLRESGSLEQDADLILFIYRDELYRQHDVGNAGVAEIIIGKHRNGPVGTIKLFFHKECVRFSPLTQGDIYA